MNAARRDSRFAHGRRRTIATQLFLAELAVVLLVTAIAAAVALRATGRQVEQLSGERALSIARSVAAVPEVRNAFASPDPASTIQPIAEAIRIRSGADFVVVANTAEIRYSHPDPSKVGERLSTPAGEVLLGHEFIGTERGTLGRSVRGKTPVRNDAGEIIGLVSVGLLIEGVQARARRDLLESLSLLAIAAVALGGLAAAAVARRVRRQTYSLDADSIGALLEHREAILGSVKEGVVSVDTEGVITLVNNEARQLLGLPTGCEGKPIGSFALPADVVAAVVLPTDEIDRPIHAPAGVLIANRRPISIRGVERGAIVTLRDRTELDRLTAELAGTRTASDTLRAQAHEFSNKLHTIGGLLALGAYDEVQMFVDQVARSHAGVGAAVSDQISDRRVAALLVAKMTLGAERNITLRLSADSELRVLDEDDAADVLVVLGNLIDNAFQSIGHDGSVDVTLAPEGGVLVVEVSDSGGGVRPEDVETIFAAGWTTKEETGHSGLGLSLARQVCRRRHGSLELTHPAPATFTARLAIESRLPAGSGSTRP